MTLKKYKPITGGQREMITISKKELWSGRPYKPLTVGKKRISGRNNAGRITVRRRGGGHKRLYRIVDFKRNIENENAVVERIEYDPNRTAYIALVKYEESGNYSYILAPKGIKAGDSILTSNSADIKTGNCMQLRYMPIGTIIHNVELKPKKGGQLAKAAGTYAQLVGKDAGYAQIKLKSGELRLVSLDSKATIGTVSNSDNQNTKIGKAGKSRALGRRPKVRGVAMNPIDHPHGGGNGKTSGGRHPVTPWGRPTKGKRTRKNKQTDKYILRKRYSK